jgi:hypothetical protein
MLQIFTFELRLSLHQLHASAPCEMYLGTGQVQEMYLKYRTDVPPTCSPRDLRPTHGNSRSSATLVNATPRSTPFLKNLRRCRGWDT